MALTMTRTRTQTTLTKLAEKLAATHGELAYLAQLQEVEDGLQEALSAAMLRRQQELRALRDSLYVVIQQFDPELDPSSIGETDAWKGPLKRFRAPRSLRKAYLASLDDRVAGSA
ncbi:hypothetical protein [Aquabacterium sp.]|uniref:hypothetical protein n=1 Tax=Aquabacterium sp. TaxID=1872578 RepID=UPI0035C6BD75